MPQDTLSLQGERLNMTSHGSASSILLVRDPMLTSLLFVSKELLVHSKVAQGAHWAQWHSACIGPWYEEHTAHIGHGGTQHVISYVMR